VTLGETEQAHRHLSLVQTCRIHQNVEGIGTLDVHCFMLNMRDHSLLHPVINKGFRPECPSSLPHSFAGIVINVGTLYTTSVGLLYPDSGVLTMIYRDITLMVRCLLKA